MAKKQKKTSNASALLAKTWAFHQYDKTQSNDLSAKNKKLMQRCGNTMSCDQELSALEVINYLMGWGDCYMSHHFETIHWHSVNMLLKKTYPILNKTR